MSSKIKSGDKIIVLTGDDRGKTGVVLRVFPKKNKAIVKEINKVKKHTKPTAENPQSGIIEKEAPISISNLAILDPKTNLPSRVGFKIDGDKKYRIAKRSGSLIVEDVKTKK